MLKSRKSKAPGPKLLAADRCACGCEVNISFRPHLGIREGACIAASGEDSMIMGLVEMVLLLPGTYLCAIN